MSLIASNTGPAAEDWGVVIQSVPSKSKKDILKQIENVFHIDKRDAEQILGNMPLILIDVPPLQTSPRRCASIRSVSPSWTQAAPHRPPCPARHG